jgi:uncharacterized protein (TIGR00251 family)
VITLDEAQTVVTGTPTGAALLVRVVPRASRTQFSGVRNGALVVKLAAPPVDGAANELLITFLADRFDVPRRNLRIDHGLRSRTKRVAIADCSVDHIVHRLHANR